jgi:hypothetical protein
MGAPQWVKWGLIVFFLDRLVYGDGIHAGPSVFVPANGLDAPPDDIKIFDARRLTIHQAAEDQVGACCPGHSG